MTTLLEDLRATVADLVHDKEELVEHLRISQRQISQWVTEYTDIRNNRARAHAELRTMRLREGEVIEAYDARVADLEKELHRMRREAQECRWRYKGHCGTPYYKTECDNAHWFENGTPEENHYKFCPFCGRQIVTEAAQ